MLKNSDKYSTLDWTPENKTAFHDILKLVYELTENKPFNQNLDTQVLVCDTSFFGLEAAVEQITDKDWVALAFASNFLNSLEQKFPS